ncbi:hypothetical protein [Rathayibacter sp. SD072]|uniref:hypothetical protein n=1 Tax=Rathayibacter sp. SD072 TaxID=2781731 RepID=UPI001A966270|nr:hypothetical protein [Rathayibacter sp. SD072]MBO0982704.1 hypothetical protein [Rathayibacter sp. SD072]
MIDFFDFTSLETRGYPEGVVPLFACSTSDVDGGGSVAITPDAVYLGKNGDVTRIDSLAIRSWQSSARGSMFALTVDSDEAHVTYLFAQLRPATVHAMTRVIGPEGLALHAA